MTSGGGRAAPSIKHHSSQSLPDDGAELLAIPVDEYHRPVGRPVHNHRPTLKAGRARGAVVRGARTRLRAEVKVTWRCVPQTLKVTWRCVPGGVPTLKVTWRCANAESYLEVCRR
eukprot:395427-Alexandrium_andersonii.AAC.1